MSDTTLHQVVPLSPHPLFLVGSISSVYLVNANDGIVQHVFATEPMASRSIQCEYSDNRYQKSSSSTGFSTFTLGYTEENTGECIVVSYTPAKGSEAIATCAHAAGAGGGWCTWEEAIETKKRVEDPGSWNIVKGKSVIGVRRVLNASRPTKQGDHRRRSAAARTSHTVPPKWQTWTATTGEYSEEDEVRPLFNPGTESEELLVVPGLGPQVKIGQRSVAFCLGNAIKIISAGGPERYTGDDDSGAESRLAKDSRRGRHGGSMRAKS